MSEELSFKDRLRVLMSQDSGDVQPGGTLSVWMSEEMVKQLTGLADEVGVSRSAMARELLLLAIPMAWREIRPDLEQQRLFPDDMPGALEQELENAADAVRERSKRRPRTRKKRAAKRTRKAVALKKRAGRG